MKENLMFLLYLFILSSFLLILYYNHMLMFIISLEILMICVYYNLYMMILILNIEFIFLIFFLIIMVCESCMGLTLIVLLVRLYGNDYMKSIMLMEW